MYKFKEVYCPYCKRKYMTRIYSEYDVIIRHKGQILKGWVDQCTTCNKDLFIQDDVLEGIDLDEYPEEEKEISFILR